MTKETDRQGSSASSNNDETMRSPYELTKTGLSGEQRETMLHSELQIMVNSLKINRKIGTDQITHCFIICSWNQNKSFVLFVSESCSLGSKR